MAISLAVARQAIAKIARDRSVAFTQDEELLTLDQGVGRTVKNNVKAPISTPTFDSAAVDGYAVIASQTSHATEQFPVMMRVMGSIKAGSPPYEVDERVFDRMVPCVEVRAGAPFPVARNTQEYFDGVVPYQHAALVSEGGSGKILRITSAPLTSWHKRIAGSDFREGDMIVEGGTLIAPKHVMALASVGVRQVPVTRLVRVGVVTTGSELSSTIINQQSMQYKIPDANGPYITAALREIGCDASYLGALPDNLEVVTAFVQDKVQNDNFDVFITTGGVATGNSAIVHALANNLAAAIHFHHVAISPGGSTLFATLPESEGQESEQARGRGFYSSTDEITTSFATPPKTPAGKRRSTVLFGLPGSPIASAVVFRFLVTPYLRTLSGMLDEREIMAKVAITPETADMMQATKHQAPWGLVVEGSNDLDIFRHAVLRSQHDGVSVEISRERSPAKTSPFATSNCWIHIPRGHVGVRAGDVASIFPFCSPKS